MNEKFEITEKTWKGEMGERDEKDEKVEKGETCSLCGTRQFPARVKKEVFGGGGGRAGHGTIVWLRDNASNPIELQRQEKSEKT